MGLVNPFLRFTGTTDFYTKILGFKGKGYELFFPLEGPKSLRAEIPEKWGKLTKFTSPVRPPKMGKITENYKNCIFGVILPFFGGIFPTLKFGGSERGEEFSNFSPFFGDFPSGRLAGPCKGKTTRKARVLE